MRDDVDDDGDGDGDVDVTVEADWFEVDGGGADEDIATG